MKDYGEIYLKNIFNNRKYISRTCVYKTNIKEPCSICLKTLKNKSNFVRKLSCSHIFHIGCIDNWTYYKDTCPVCRKKVIF